MSAVPDAIRILTVDDHLVFREGLAMILATQSDMRLVAQASNGREAIQQFRQHQDLLLPTDLFKTYARNLAVNFDSVRSLATTFETSLTAIAIRLVELGSFPGMIIYLVDGRRRWFIPGPDIPSTLWPRESPKSASIAWELLNGIKTDLGHLPQSPNR